jgi:imidazolonepropionase-like amidohydrolase
MKTLAALAVAVAALLSGAAAAKAPVDLLIQDATVIDVAAGKAVPHRSVAVEDGLIVAVGARAAIDKA